MAIRHYSPEELVRLKLLHELPDRVIVPTRDAMLLAGVLSVTDWQRRKARGETPPVYRMNGITDGFKVGDCKVMATRRVELADRLPRDAA
jgi:hypothetical protein